MSLNDGYARLEGRNVIPCSFDEAKDMWSEEGRERRRVARDEIENIVVSTVFLVMDHGYDSPLWFETMVFGGPDNEWQDRYATYDEAEAGHKAVVAKIKAGERLDTGE